MTANRERVLYAFGHLVGSYGTDAHAADSGDEGQTVLRDEGLSDAEIEIVHIIAEDVAGNYRYTGEADEVIQRIQAGTL